MAKRQINKNLVAFLTAAGIVAAVVVVAIATINAAQRDPRVIAEKAAKQEQAGDLERAVELYRRAYSINKEAKYLIEAARCAWEMGEIVEMFGLLRLAYAQSPSNPEVLNALLERYWELRAYPIAQPWEDILTYADGLLQLQPENLLALVSKAVALQQMSRENPAYESESAAVLARAAEIDPTDPRVAVVRAVRVHADAFERAVELRRDGRVTQADRVLAEARQRRLEILEPAAEAHPDDVSLIVAISGVLAEQDDWTGSRARLVAGLERNPDSARLHVALAALLLEEAQRKRTQASAEELGALISEGTEHIDRTLALDAAYYQAYALRAEFQRLAWELDGRWERERGACQSEILAGLATGLRETVGLRTPRARLGQYERLRHIARSYELALGFYQTAPDEAARAEADRYLREFLQMGQTQYPEHPMVYLMEGHTAALDGDTRLAIKAFREAERRALEQPGGELLARVAKEQLARQYRIAGEAGSALRYVEEVLAEYTENAETPPTWLYVLKAELLAALDRTQDALDLIDSIAGGLADSQAGDALHALRARLLTRLGRTEEARVALGRVASDDPRIMVAQAGTALLADDHATAEKLLRGALAAQPENETALRLLLQVLLNQQRRDEALGVIDELLARVQDQRVRQNLEQYRIVVGETDPQRRRQKLLEFISRIPDPMERAAQSFNLLVAEGNYEEAIGYLDQMEAAQPDNVDVLRMQFDIAVRLEKCARAEKYVSRLAQLNADRVGGALYRGRYELQCGEPERALTEFRVAEREFPTDPDLKLRVAQSLLLLEPPRLDEAMQALEQALEFDPRNFAAHKLLYLCYEQSGRREEGLSHLEEAAKIRPDDPFVKQRQQILEEERDPVAGIGRREQLREQDPKDVANLLRLVELYQRAAQLGQQRGQQEEAERFTELARRRLEEAFALEPANAAVVRAGIDLYARQQDRTAGEELLKRHLEAQSGYGRVAARVLAGRFYEMLNDRDAALDAYRQACDSVDQEVPAGTPEHDRALVISVGELAEFYRRTGAYEEMVDAYRRVLSHLEPTEVASAQAVRRNIIQGLLTLRRFGDVEREVAAYREDYPRDPRGLMLQAELLLARHKLDEAHAALTRVLEDYPDNAWCRYIRGRINLEQGRYREARSDLLRAKTVTPYGFNLAHRLDLARLYELTEEYGLAEKELRELLPLRRGDRRAELRLISLLENSGQVTKAQAFVNELIAREPDEPFWHYQLGRLLLAREEYSAAVGPLTKAFELTRGAAPEVVGELLRALTRSNRVREATQLYENLDPEKVSPWVRARAAEAYLAANQRQIAVALLEQAVDGAAQRGIEALRQVIGQAADLIGENESLALLHRVYEHAGDNPAAEAVLRTTLAALLVSRDDPAQRAAGLELAKSVVADRPPGDQLHVSALMTQAAAHIREGQAEQAVRLYEQVLEYAPDHPHVLNNLAYLLAEDLGRPTEALPYAERLHDLAGEVPNFLDTVGWVYQLNGRTAEAEGLLREALRLNPEALEPRYHLGRLYAERGQRPAAERELTRLLELARAQENEEYQQKAEKALKSLH